MTIPTEPIGSIPRPLELIEAIATRGGGDPALEALYEQAIRDTIERFEATGSPVITDGDDDTSTSRETAFAKIRARVLGTELASRQVGDTA
jgi:methionine synthase II (cobalamin-independent)